MARPTARKLITLKFTFKKKNATCTFVHTNVFYIHLKFLNIICFK